MTCDIRTPCPCLKQYHDLQTRARSFNITCHGIVSNKGMEFSNITCHGIDPNKDMEFSNITGHGIVSNELHALA
jgi:hypothetical protein